MRIQTKKGAIELSIGTMVIIVLAMTMLILGIVLLRNIFGGAAGVIDLVDKNTQAEVNQLFNDENTKVVTYLPNGLAEVDKGKTYSVGFGIKNTVRGESTAGTFDYAVKATEPGSQCPASFTTSVADRFITQGKTGSNIKITPGEINDNLRIRMFIPEDAPLCSVRYTIEVRKSGQPYGSDFFDVDITAD